MLLQTEIQQSVLPVIVIISAFVIVVLALIFLIFFITARQQQNKLVMKQQMMQQEFSKQLMQSQIEVQEHTSAALSQEIHDNIGQLLGATKMLLAVTERELKEVPDSFETATQTLSKAIQDLRALSKSLNKEWLKNFDLIHNLKSEVARINAAKEVDVQFQTEYETLPLSSEAQVMLFRVIQEALQNSIRHAHPSQILIEIKLDAEELSIIVNDNGKGFDFSHALQNGLGLRNMQHRIELLHGHISWHQNDSGGTAVEITLADINKSRSVA